MVSPSDIAKQIVRYDDSYGVFAADGTRIPLPMVKGKWVKFPVVVTVTNPQPDAYWYSVVIMPKPYSGFVDKWTDKIANSDFLIHLASKSMPRTAGFAMFGFFGAIAGAVLGTLFTPSNVSKETKLEGELEDGIQIVYWALCEWQNQFPPTRQRY